jgi:diketogulonate reductase-like aldo/keto reductase
MKYCFKLANDMPIPMIGYGPGIMSKSDGRIKHYNRVMGHLHWLYNKHIVGPTLEEGFIESISNALKAGCRLIDYSSAYGNERLIGKAIRQSGIPREDIFLTARISDQAQIQGKVREQVLHALSEMKVDSIELLQFHWPLSDYYLKTWDEMRKLRDEGYCKVLGVANCNIRHIDAIYNHSGEYPLVNQFECHPLFTQKELINYCQKKGIQVEAYTPVARYDDRIVNMPLLRRMENKYKKSFIQIILRWHVQNGVIPVFRSHNAKHQKSNIDIFDFSLSEEDMRKIDDMNLNSRLRYDPDKFEFFNY